jgi:hypothetical protein
VYRIVAPEALTIAARRQGNPEEARPGAQIPIFFNISHDTAAPAANARPEKTQG